MTDPAHALLDATGRLERADQELRAARAWAATTVPGATLRERVADRRRIDAALAERDAARAAFDAAQDVDCPGEDRPMDTIGLAAEVAEIRSGLAALQDRFQQVMTEVRDLPGGEMVWRRIDAYPGTRLDRDMGAGKDADGWLAEVADLLDGGEG